MYVIAHYNIFFKLYHNKKIEIFIFIRDAILRYVTS